MLLIKNLNILALKKEILKNISLTIKPGEIHVMMGPNGAGKTSLAMSLMGHPSYKFNSALQNQSSKLKVNGRNMFPLKPEERAKSGLFVSFQSPPEIENVSVFSFLRAIHKSVFPKSKMSITEFKDHLKKMLKMLDLKEEFSQRSMNHNFSGGEKKKMEIVQFLLIKPKYAIFDEIDSGLDIDSLKIISKIISDSAEKDKTGILLITHHANFVSYLNPDFVHILKNGEIIKSGKRDLINLILEKGYDTI